MAGLKLEADVSNVLSGIDKIAKEFDKAGIKADSLLKDLRGIPGALQGLAGANAGVKLSGSFNNACIAASEREGVYTVDSRMLSSGVALLAIEGAECRDRGMSAADIAAHLRELTGKVDTSFVLDTLEFMWKGGRCSGVAALGANLLHLKPGLEMRDGKLSVYKKYRGSINSVYRQYVKERLAGAEIRPGHVFVTDSGEVPEETIRELMDMVRAAVPGAEVHSAKAGCTITSHCGPKTLGVLFLRK